MLSTHYQDSPRKIFLTSLGKISFQVIYQSFVLSLFNAVPGLPLLDIYAGDEAGFFILVPLSVIVIFSFHLPIPSTFGALLNVIFSNSSFFMFSG